MPKLNYYFRTYLFRKLRNRCKVLNNKIKTIIQKLLDTNYSKSFLSQTLQSVTLGGLGVRSVADMILPDFLALTIEICKIEYKNEALAL